MCNHDIRQAAASANVRLWMIAEKLQISDGNFSRKLRKELPADEKLKIFKIINSLAREAI